ncbi:EndoU domain-containing protein [Coleofasciculus sp. H7-2]|uniref:EndoU domain-containing protein n=1 Tax=Coleofasciculus sp. H7-2 TaxID=3351545 RepID=UPI00366D553F
MREKILYRERVPNPNSPVVLSNKLIGAHSPRIKIRPDFDVEVISNNADSTTTVKLVKQFPDGSISKFKKSTLAPDSWSDDKIINVTNQVACTPLATSLRGDSSTLHRQIVDGVEWEVMKDSSGKVTSSYPTGGTPTTNF